ncbi:hypothetical protein PS723_05783 [Pseudomonas fluorescens]|uniref:Uncharacterized protein n=1 Tax=Pseudomonas fluorescens TaxID=294 RepID=A0A5E7FMI2_PSEFL|nr:hypothetical protein PS723_05783 [Pseudomonas fluorescens]
MQSEVAGAIRISYRMRDTARIGDSPYATRQSNGTLRLTVTTGTHHVFGFPILSSKRISRYARPRLLPTIFMSLSCTGSMALFTGNLECPKDK